MNDEQINSPDPDAEDDKPGNPPYKSREGFETVPLLRGFTEIAALFEIAQELGGILCGGYARFCASPSAKPIAAGDIDVYAGTDAIFEALKARFAFLGLAVRHENEMSFTYTRPDSGPLVACPTIQLIKPIREGRVVAVGSVTDILANFDFTVVRAAIINPRECLVDADFMHDESNLNLRLKNIHSPISSTLRVMKYVAKGYWMRPMAVLALFLDWEARDEDYKLKLIEWLKKASEGDGLSKEEITELEALMRID